MNFATGTPRRRRARTVDGQRTAGLCVQSFVAQLLHVLHAQFVATLGLDRPGAPLTVPEVVQHIFHFSIAGIERPRGT